MRDMKIYKNISKKGLLIALLKSERSFPELQKINSNNARIKKFIKNFHMLRHKFQKTKLIGKKLRKIIKNENLFRLKKAENKKHLTKFLKELNKHEKYCDHNDRVYYRIRDIINLFDKMDEDYYKPIRDKSAFNDNYIEYESREDKKKSSIREYLLMIEPCLRDMINDLKAIGK